MVGLCGIMLIQQNLTTMIKINYDHPNIKVNTGDVSKVFNLPLKVEIVNHIGKSKVWETEMFDNYWATFEHDSIFDIRVFDGNGEIILDREWNVVEDGTYLDQALYFYCKKIKNPKGLAIGVHDGEFGEWVAPVVEGLTNATLVEASIPQFEKLSKHYVDKSNVDLVFDLVTTDGSDIEFFEGGKGYTNSVKEGVIKSWETEEIRSSIRNSVAINDLLKEISPDKKLDWLHLDIEGYDDDVIRAIEVDLLPNFIIFEHNNLLLEDKLRLESYLMDLGYSLERSDKVSYLAVKH